MEFALQAVVVYKNPTEDEETQLTLRNNQMEMDFDCWQMSLCKETDLMERKMHKLFNYLILSETNTENKSKVIRRKAYLDMYFGHVKTFIGFKTPVNVDEHQPLSLENSKNGNNSLEKENILLIEYVKLLEREKAHLRSENQKLYRQHHWLKTELQRNAHSVNNQQENANPHDLPLPSSSTHSDINKGTKETNYDQLKLEHKLMQKQIEMNEKLISCEEVQKSLEEQNALLKDLNCTLERSNAELKSKYKQKLKETQETEQAYEFNKFKLDLERKEKDLREREDDLSKREEEISAREQKSLSSALKYQNFQRPKILAATMEENSLLKESLEELKYRLKKCHAEKASFGEKYNLIEKELQAREEKLAIREQKSINRDLRYQKLQRPKMVADYEQKTITLEKKVEYLTTEVNQTQEKCTNLKLRLEEEKKHSTTLEHDLFKLRNELNNLNRVDKSLKPKLAEECKNIRNAREELESSMKLLEQTLVACTYRKTEWQGYKEKTEH